MTPERPRQDSTEPTQPEIPTDAQYIHDVEAGVESPELDAVYALSADFKKKYAAIAESVQTKEEAIDRIADLVKNTAGTINPGILQAMVDKPHLFQSLMVGRAQRERSILLPYRKDFNRAEEPVNAGNPFSSTSDYKESEVLFQMMSLAYMVKDVSPEVQQEIINEATSWSNFGWTERFKLSTNSVFGPEVTKPENVERLSNAAKTFRDAVNFGRKIEVYDVPGVDQKISNAWGALYHMYGNLPLFFDRVITKEIFTYASGNPEGFGDIEKRITRNQYLHEKTTDVDKERYRKYLMKYKGYAEDEAQKKSEEDTRLTD